MTRIVVVVVGSVDGSDDVEELLQPASRTAISGSRRKRRTAKVRRAPLTGSNPR
jgi:hypothetical protein